MKYQTITDNKLTQQECYFYVSGYIDAKQNKNIPGDIMIKFRKFLKVLK